MNQSVPEIQSNQLNKFITWTWNRSTKLYQGTEGNHQLQKLKRFETEPYWNHQKYFIWISKSIVLRISPLHRASNCIQHCLYRCWNIC